MLPRFKVGDIVRIDLGPSLVTLPGGHYDHVHDQKGAVVRCTALEISIYYDVLLLSGDKIHINEVYLIPLREYVWVP